MSLSSRKQSFRWMQSASAVVYRLKDSGLALIEQGTQSALNFVMMFLISKFCGLEALGLYALGRYLMLLVGGMQNSLISFPYTIFFRQRKNPLELGYARMHLMMCLAFGGVSTLFFLGLTILVSVNFVSLPSAGNSNLSWACVALAFATPMFLVREFSRRHEFAHLRTTAAMWFSVLTAFLQLSGLAALHQAGQLTIVSAFFLIGASCLATSVVWMVVRRKELGQGRATAELVNSTDAGSPGMSSILAKNWTVGKWIFSTQTIMDFLLLVVQSLLVVLVDAKAGGIFAACFAVASLCNPIIRGLSNLLTPVFAKTYSESSASSLVESVKRTSLAFAGLLLFLGVGIVLFGDLLVGLFYDKPIPHLTHLLAVISLSMFFQATGLPAFHALNTIGQPRKAFSPRLIGVVLAALFLVTWGFAFRELGAAYSLLVANVLITTFTCYRFLTTAKNIEGANSLVAH